MSFLLYLVTAIIAWRFCRGHLTAAHQTSRVMAVIAGALLICVCISGALRDIPLMPEIHHWLGHVVVLLIGSLIAFSIGVALSSEACRRPGLTFAKVSVLLSLFAVIHLASISGYLPLDDADEGSRIETHRRFFVFHQAIFPLVAMSLLPVWYWLFRYPDDQEI